MTDLRSWIGRHEQAAERLDVRAARTLAAVLERDADLASGSPLPPMWQWVYFTAALPSSALGADGHPARGGFMPPVQLPRRMFAGGRARFVAPMPLDAVVIRRQTITAVEEKQGRSGPLVFVTAEQEFRSGGEGEGGELLLSEEQDIVYRDHSATLGREPPSVTPDEWPWRSSFTADPVLLFRFSATTFNAHRIHYDRTYAMQVDGYPGLVVHGPLLALQLLELVHQHAPEVQVSSFEFRALAPLFEGETVGLGGRPASDSCIDLAAWGRDMRLAMTAHASLFPPDPQ